jgi:hypothetical protein
VPRPKRGEPGIAEATARYEAWLAAQVPLIRSDLELKHRAMSAGSFPFLRATFYRWAECWRATVGEAAEAPEVLAVGDLHVENFGTWRDAEGRLIWGVNDFDEAWPLPYTNDLVRLATSALIAVGYHDLAIEPKRAVRAILGGYRAALDAGGRPFVLEEHHPELRDMAIHRLHDPERFWDKLEGFSTAKTPVPEMVMAALRRALPERELETRIVHRIAGLGSLGRQRFVAIAAWNGGRIAREAKALAPSACTMADGGGKIHYEEILRRSVRCPDPCVAVRGAWLVRRLAPDCSRIALNALPKKRHEEQLLEAMGWETANVHLGSSDARALRADLQRRTKRWLYDAASRMADAVEADWREWSKTGG